MLKTQGSERKCHIIEKEAIAIVEAVWKWNHYLTRQHFTQITNQRSVAFIFSNEKRTKIKNAKNQVWWLELSTLDYTIKYCHTSPAFAGLSGIHVGWGIEINGKFEAERPPATTGLPSGGRAAFMTHMHPLYSTRP